jgi:hypothetical protein
MMANQCLVCIKHFVTAKGLKAHTGTTDPTARIAHTCNDCKKSFCSPNALNLHRESPKHKEKAGRRQTHVGIKATTDIVRPNNDKFFRCQKDLERHRDAPAHRTTFHCSVCKEYFDTELTMGYHEHSSTHKRLLELAEFGVYVDTTGDNVSLYSVSNYGRVYSESYITCRLTPLIPWLIHLPQRCLVTPAQVPSASTTQTMHITVTKVARNGRILIASRVTSNGTGHSVTRTVHGADIVQMAWTTDTSRPMGIETNGWHEGTLGLCDQFLHEVKWKETGQ